MATIIRPEISKKNKYWIDKHRHYELKHFCLQYPEWKRVYAEFENPKISSSTFERIPTTNVPGDPTAKRATLRAHYAEKIRLIEETARATDRYLYDYIMKGVTEGVSYTYLKSRLGMPCGKDMYYDRYRRFFWLLNEARG
nr:MAG TPA: hypothetical protein [Bacteriophage sp.]